MSRLSRDKGRRLEQEAVRLLRPVFPDACRNFQQWARSDGRDIDGTSGLCVQVKGGARPPIYRGLSEAIDAAEAGEVPVCLHRRDRDSWLATLRGRRIRCGSFGLTVHAEELRQERITAARIADFEHLAQTTPCSLEPACRNNHVAKHSHR